MEKESISQWAIIEQFGHQKIAGLLSEQTIGGCAFVRVDVPAVGDHPAWTKLLGQGAIYAINFVTQEIATAAAKAFGVAPISAYDIPELRQLRLSQVVTDGGDDDIDGVF